MLTTNTSAMKNFLLLALFLLAGIATKAQSTTITNPEEAVIGTWKVQQGEPAVRLQSLIFFGDGTINIDYPDTKRVQRYKIFKAEKGYTLQLLEIIKGKPLESINISHLSDTEMEVRYLEDTRAHSVKFKKVSS
jgi:hypothetical protein